MRVALSLCFDLLDERREWLKLAGTVLSAPMVVQLFQAWQQRASRSSFLNQGGAFDQRGQRNQFVSS
jgi:hypothetical protein